MRLIACTIRSPAISACLHRNDMSKLCRSQTQAARHPLRPICSILHAAGPCNGTSRARNQPDTSVSSSAHTWCCIG